MPNIWLPDFPTALYLGGVWRPARSGASFAVDDPASGDVLAKVADAGAEDGIDALAAAASAQANWAATAPRERSELLREMFDRITARKDDFAAVITAEMGKSLAEAEAEIGYGAEFFRWFSEEAVRVRGEYLRAPTGTGRILTVPKPVGPTVLITPWNFPLAMATRKIGPAFAAGCTVVLKPAEQTPLTALLLAALADDVGVPAGVLNVVTTSDPASVVEALTSDSRARKLSFTGSTEVGRHLIGRSGEQVLRVSMELGGNAPFLVCDDADLDAAVDGAVVAKMRNIGESCIAANRFLVHADVAEAFTTRLSERLAALRVGPGYESGTDVGPLIDDDAVERIDALVNDAVDRGATVRTGGRRVDGPGRFYEPTVLGDVHPDSELLHQEVFGPVAPVVTFTTDDEAVALANDTLYGLAAYVYTTDHARVLAMIDRLDAGLIGVNRGLISDSAAPFGGVKQSGLGKEGGAQGIAEFLDWTYVALES